jgi:hypothetical protein
MRAMNCAILGLKTMRLTAFLLGACLGLARVGSAATNEATSVNPGDLEIQPFSSLRWDDGLIDVVTKLNKFAALKTLKWQVAGVPMSKSVLNVVNPEELSELAAVLYERPAMGEFTDFEGKKAVSPGLRWRPFITAEEVNIAGIPFVLAANLDLEPGFAVTHPTNVLSFRTKKGPAILPAVLSSVELSSKSKTIADNLSELIAAAKIKYPKGKLSEVKQDRSRTGSFVAVDKTGHQFEMTWSVGLSGAKARISYESLGADVTWTELYRKHLSALEEKRIQSNRDMKTDL